MPMVGRCCSMRVNIKIFRSSGQRHQSHNPQEFFKCKKQRPVRHSSTCRQVALDKVPDGFGDKGYGWPHLRGHPQASRETWMWLVVSIEEMAQDAVKKGDEVFRETSCWYYLGTYIYVSSISIGAGAVFRFIFWSTLSMISFMTFLTSQIHANGSISCLLHFLLLIARHESCSVILDLGDSAPGFDDWAESMFLRLGQPHRWLGARRQGLVNVEGLFNHSLPQKTWNVVEPLNGSPPLFSL